MGNLLAAEQPIIELDELQLPHCNYTVTDTTAELSDLQILQGKNRAEEQSSDTDQCILKLYIHPYSHFYHPDKS